MQKMLSILFGFLLLLFIAPLQPLEAQTEGIGFEIYPPQTKQEDVEPVVEALDDTTEKVVVTFTNVQDSGLKVCLRNDLCLQNSFMRNLAEKDPTRILKLIESGLSKDEIAESDKDDVGDHDHFVDLEGNSITVCADGEHMLKTDCEDDSKNYFHAGRYYVLTLYADNGGTYIKKGLAAFYVNHHQPKVTVTPLKNTSPELFDVELTLDKLSKDGRKNSNNFQFVIEGQGIKEEHCVGDVTANTPVRFTLPTEKWLNDKDHWIDDKPSQGVISGQYIIKINERINEGGNNVPGFDDNCQGGFTFAHHVCTVTKEGTQCNEIIDPNQSDANKLFEILELIAGGGKGVTLPCTRSYSVKNPLDCKEIHTAIGPIALNPVGFVTRIFSIVLSIAGVGALLLIIYSGYRLLLSRGNKEAIQGARETLTAAIVGLLFIVFSLVILSVIAGDILNIPGFN